MIDQIKLRAERLRAVTSMPEYQDTIGKWIEDGLAQALHDMTSAKEPQEFHAAQGAYKAITSLKDTIQQVFIKEDAAIKKDQKKLTKQKDK